MRRESERECGCEWSEWSERGWAGVNERETRDEGVSSDSLADSCNSNSHSHSSNSDGNLMRTLVVSIVKHFSTSTLHTRSLALALYTSTRSTHEGACE